MSYTSSIEHEIKLLNELADISGKEILPLFRTKLEINDKAEPGNFDPVTEADRKAEKVIREKLEQVVSQHGIIGEEFGIKDPSPTGNEIFQWVIDPIDGTRGFMSGFPTWGTLIGLLKNSKPYIGLMNQPFTGERYWSDSQKSYYRNASKIQEIQTRKCSSIENAILASTAPEMFKTPEDKAAFDNLWRHAKLTRFGGDCYSYCLLAAGHIDLVMECGLQIYDIAPLIPIIETAGGIVTTWDGSDATNGGNILAAGDPELHKKALEILKRGKL